MPDHHPSPSRFEHPAILRIYIGESEKTGDLPLYEAIVRQARKAGLAGATVLRSPLGYGASSHFHTSKILRLSQDLPMIVEIVDDSPALEAFAQSILPLPGGGLVTLTPTRVITPSNPGES